jgi:hypothetical protein
VITVISGAAVATVAQRDNLVASFDASGPLRNAHINLNALNIEFKIELVQCDTEANTELQRMEKLLLESAKNGKLLHEIGAAGLKCPAIAVQQKFATPCHDSDRNAVAPTPSMSMSPSLAPTPHLARTPAELVAVLQLYSMTKEEFNGWSAGSSKHQAFAEGLRNILGITDTTISIASISAASPAEKEGAVAIVDESGGEAKETIPAISISFRIQFKECSAATNHIIQLLPVKLHSKLSELMGVWAGLGISIPALAIQNSMAVLCSLPTPVPTNVPTNSPTAAPTNEPMTPAPTAPPGSLIYINEHTHGKSHFQTGRNLRPGVSVSLHLFGLPSPHMFAKLENRKVFADAVQAAFCPVGPLFPDSCNWRKDLNERVVVESYRFN